ncbi:MAG: NAD(P)-dependent oxidoreductase, partial [Acidimicrobiales bacterium]|nr:NAD(P)-dependent oxidoreductase [Acidimicrobiales bacterium]
MRVLITGAAGRIGGYLRSRLARPDRVLRLLDIVPLMAGPGEEVVQGSVDDVDVLIEASRDVDAVIHLAGIPSETE